MHERATDASSDISQAAPLSALTIFFMQNTNVVVVGQQTAAAPVVIETHSVGDHFLTLSVIMVILSVCCGTIFLVCTIPAVLLASSVRYYHS